MSQIELEPGVPGKFSEPRWSESRKAYQIHCLVGEPFGDPSKVHASGKSKPKAIANLKKRVAAWKPKVHSVGRYAQDVSVENLSRAWLAVYENDKSKRPQNSKHYRREIEPATKGRGKKDKVTIVGSTLGKMKAADVRPFHVRIHLEQMLGTSYKVSRQKSILRGAFQLLVDDGFRDDNPVNSVKVGSATTSGSANKPGRAANRYFPAEPQPFNAEEMAQYWALEGEYFPRPFQPRIYEQRYQDFTKLAYELAARPSEALAVRWDDVDFETGVVTISGTIIDTELRVHQVKGVLEEFELADDEVVLPRGWPNFSDEDVVCIAYRQPFTKTRESMRALRVGSECLAMLRRRKLAATPGHRLVIPSRTGNVVRSEQMSKTWKFIVKGSGLEWSAVKTLRSTRATRVAEAYGLPAARLMLGHEENSPITAKHYVLEERAVVDFADAR